MKQTDNRTNAPFKAAPRRVLTLLARAAICAALLYGLVAEQGADAPTGAAEKALFFGLLGEWSLLEALDFFFDLIWHIPGAVYRFFADLFDCLRRAFRYVFCARSDDDDERKKSR